MNKDYFTSDLHFFHKNILKFCNRPIGNLTNEQWLESEIAKVPSGSTLWHLGDLSFSRDAIYDILKFIAIDCGLDLNLIVGNHDDVPELKKAIVKINQDYPRASVRVRDYYEISVGRMKENLGADYKDRLGIEADKIVLFHFAIEEWNKCHRGSLHFHGHSHGSLNNNTMVNRIDVGIDSLGKVMSMEEVILTLKEQNKTSQREPKHH